MFSTAAVAFFKKSRKKIALGVVLVSLFVPVVSHAKFWGKDTTINQESLANGQLCFTTCTYRFFIKSCSPEQCEN